MRQGILHSDCIGTCPAEALFNYVFQQLYLYSLGVPVTHVSVSNDGHCLLASCLDSKVRLLETDTGELLNAYTGHQANSMRAEGRLSHDDACVLSTSEDGRVVAWDIVQAVMVRQFKVRQWHVLKRQFIYQPKNARATLIAHTNQMLTRPFVTMSHDLSRLFHLQSHQSIIIRMAGAVHSLIWQHVSVSTQ